MVNYDKYMHTAAELIQLALKEELENPSSSSEWYVKKYTPKYTELSCRKCGYTYKQYDNPNGPLEERTRCDGCGSYMTT